MQTTSPVLLPLEVALYFVQQLPPNYQDAIFEWLVSSKQPKIATENTAEMVELWNNASTSQFLAGYSKEDEIYDKL